jgi:hypothetical protein
MILNEDEMNRCLDRTALFAAMLHIRDTIAASSQGLLCLGGSYQCPLGRPPRTRAGSKFGTAGWAALIQINPLGISGGPAPCY